MFFVIYRFPESLGYKFFGPEVTQCIKLGSNEDLPVFLGEVSALAKINVMFWPVNDSIDPHDHFGGTRAIFNVSLDIISDSCVLNMFYQG